MGITYWGHPIDDTGLFYEDSTRTRYIDYISNEWFFGHDTVDGRSTPWMRCRRNILPNHKHAVCANIPIIDGIWQAPKPLKHLIDWDAEHQKAIVTRKKPETSYGCAKNRN